MHEITPNTRGHYPKGYPISTTGGGSSTTDTSLEEYSDKPDLDLIKGELRDVQSDAASYYSRNRNALQWWNSYWPGQTVDGRKWNDTSPDTIFPWEGASDTRTRTVKMIINEHRTVGMYALMNMKLQARSTRPSQSTKEAGQATTLLNWQLFSQLQAEWHRESKLNLAWRNGYGCAVARVGWTQERRVDKVPINTMQFGQYIQMVTQQPIEPTDVAGMLESKDYESDLLDLIQSMSPILTRGKARGILKDLRDLRTAEVPIPYIYKSQPCITTLRPMVDVYFPIDTFDLQSARFVDEVERVSEVELYDRIETAGYDPAFVKEACEHKGNSAAGQPWVEQTNFERQTYGGRGGGGQEHQIELHHFWYYAYDMGAPVLCKTVFHPDISTYAVHGPSEYVHGQMPFHSMRFEIDDRPILSSMGIAEIAYTWEQELKIQFDGRTDRASLAISPPMFSDHGDVQKVKAAFKPKSIIPFRRGTEPRFAPPPPYDPGSIQISQDVMHRIDRYFGLFGGELDPQLKQMRQMEVVDDILSEWKPVFQQMFKLDQQFLPDQDITEIVGQLARPFQIDRKDIQAGHELTATVDLRELDKDAMKEKAAMIAQILPLDTAGIIDRTALIRNLFSAIDFDLADTAIRDPQAASNKEVTEEIDAVSKIVGSGIEQPLPPEGSNFQLRQQTMEKIMQATPSLTQKVSQDPDVAKVLQTRALYYQRQLQQQENAQIGKVQVQQSFGKSAPMVGPADGGQ